MDFNDYVNQGFAFLQKKEFGPALENLRAAQKLKPDNQDIQNMITMSEEMARAESQASQSLANEARHRAESIGMKVEDVDKAIAEYTEALKRNPNDASVKSKLSIAYYIRGVTFSSKGEHPRAIEDYSQAIKLEPDYPHALNKLGFAYSDNGNFDEAIETFKKLIDICPDYNMADSKLADAYLKRGMVNYDKKDYSSAISDFKESLKLKPDNTTRELLEMAEAEKAKQ